MRTKGLKREPIEMDHCILLPLSREGEVAMVDKDVPPEVLKHSWSLHPNGYAAAWVTKDGETRFRYLHQEVLGTERGEMVDHINGVKLDNCRDNLSLTTPCENQNKAMRSARNRTGFVGVWRRGNRFGFTLKRWKRIYRVGGFATAHEAAIFRARARYVLESTFRGPVATEYPLSTAAYIEIREREIGRPLRIREHLLGQRAREALAA